MTLEPREQWGIPTLNYRRLTVGPPPIVEHPSKPRYRLLAEVPQVFPPRAITRMVIPMVLFPPTGTMAVFTTSELIANAGLIITRDVYVTGPDDEIVLYIFNCSSRPAILHAGGTLADVMLHKICRPSLREI